MTQTTTGRLGLGNRVREETEVFHTTVMGKSSIGRIVDLVVAWALKKDRNLPSDLRTKIQLILDAAAPEKKGELGYFEFAWEDNQAWIVVRSAIAISKESDFSQAEQGVRTMWSQIPLCPMIESILSARDELSAWVHPKMQLVEWQWVVSLVSNPNQSTQTQMKVYVDGSDQVSTFHGKYVDMGDVPFEKLLGEVYRTAATQPREKAELYHQGQSLQGEEEAVRVAFEREQEEIEESVRFAAEEASEEEFETFVQSNGSGSDSESSRKADQYLEETIGRLRTEQTELKDQTKQAIREAKKSEIDAQRKAFGLHKKVTQLEGLLKKKELAHVRSQNQLKLLNDKVQEFQKKSGGNDAGIKAFRDKAIQMHQKLLKVVEQKAELEKLLKESKTKDGGSDQAADSDGMIMKQNIALQKRVDELSKQIDRTQRVLEVEKNKTKQLSERVMVAEKESQSSAPIIEDLERKVEQSLRLTQQHKKETEAIKQKLIHAESEKNKIQNEFMKAQAQIQTLMKRQAS